MARKTGKFLDKTSTVSADDQVGMLSVPGAEIIEVQEETWPSIIWGWFKGLLGFGLLLAIIGAGLFTGLGMTILNYAPLDPDSSERSIVLRGAWADTGGNPPVGTTAAVSSSKPAPTSNWWEWATISWVGIPNPSTVTIASTDYDELYITGTLDNMTVTSINNPTVKGDFVAPAFMDLEDTYEEGETFEENLKLDKQYLVQCVSGTCEPGTYFVVNETQIYGEVR